jgi:hypothetical protein
MNSHRVRRLRWQVRVPSRDEAFDVRMRLRTSVNDEMVPAIGRAFDAIGASDVVHVRRLVLQVRASNSGAIEQASLASIHEQLVEQLSSLALAGDAASAGATGTRVKGTQEHSVGTLLQYLRTGMLPWHASGISDLASPAGLTAIAHDELRAVVAAIPYEPGAAAIFVFRLLTLLPATAWPVLARHVEAEFSGVSHPDLVATIDKLAAAAGPGSAVQLRLASAVITVAALPPLSPSEAERVRTTLNVRPGDVPSHPDLERFDLLRALLGSGRGEQSPSAFPRGPALPTGARLPMRPSSPGGRDTEPALSDLPGDHRPDADLFGLPVSGAGVVLLAPFLVRLFEARGIGLAATARIATADLPRACALLHYATAGRQDGYEFELGLIKVMLGLSPETPVPFSGGLLEPGDADEVDGLLASVIGHWQVLKNTSVEGLRSSFLQRPGLLTERADAWRLQVESAAIDLLLAQLPWSISVILLPWCKKPIQTEWAAR